MTQGFRLVRHFTIACFAVIAAAAIIFGLLYREIAKQDTIAIVERENITRAQVIVNHFWAGIEPLIHSLEGLRGEALQSHPAHAEIMASVTGGLEEHFGSDELGSTLKIKIFNPEGILVFSTSAGDIGKDGALDAGFISAIKGNPYSKLIHKHVMQSLNGDLQHINLVESYIPIHHGGPETPIEAVFELYSDVTPVMERINRNVTKVIIGVTLTLLAVYGALVLIVARADRIILRTEKSLSESEERLRSVIDSSSDAIIVIDAHGVIVSWNNGAGFIFGYDKAEITGRPVTQIIPKRYENAHEAGLQRSRETGETRLIGKTVELIGRRKDGSEFPLELTLGMWKSGKKIYYSGIIRDLTSRKETERLLSQHQKMESLGTLSGGIAHEINNMLLPILALTRMMADEYPPDNKDRKRAEIVIQAAGRIKDLISRLLTFSRLEKIERQNIDLSAVIGETVNLLRSTIPKTVCIEDRLDKRIGTVFADSSQIQALLINLAVNSAAAMEGKVGKIEIMLERVFVDETPVNNIQCLKSGAWAKLTVKDNGCGMDEEALQRIFDPFFTTKKVGEGTGLGLPMVHGIVTRHGGVISIASKPGEGTTINVYLPLVENAMIA